MQDYTAARTDQSADRLWLLEHPPVYTLGQAAWPDSQPRIADIPVVRSDRGGRITYHGPGQIILYALIDIRRAGLGVKRMVELLERSTIDLLADFGVSAATRPGAPGVYVGGDKIASLGLRVRRGCTYHGLALNVEVDLAPFELIDPCGLQGLAMTRLVDHAPAGDLYDVGRDLAQVLARSMGRELTVEGAGERGASSSTPRPIDNDTCSRGQWI